MGFLSFDIVPKAFVGVDIGSSALRMVEIAGWGDRRTLKNYGELHVRTLYDKPFRSFEKNTLLLSTQDIARAIRGVQEEAGIQERNTIFSISDYSSFFTNFELPPMSEKELADAVQFEARRHVPLPLSEVALDWELLEKPQGKHDPYKILLMAVPKEVLNYYEEIGRLARLNVVAMEAEVFGAIRVHVPRGSRPVVLLDIGSHTTMISVVYKGLLRTSHSIGTGGNDLTERIAQVFSIGYDEAEVKKRTEGLHIASGNVQILLPVIDTILLEVRKLIDTFQTDEKEEVQRVVLTGGSAALGGLQEYFARQIRLPVEAVYPFQQILYPPILEKRLQETKSLYTVAVGMALKGFE